MRNLPRWLLYKSLLEALLHYDDYVAMLQNARRKVRADILALPEVETQVTIYQS